MEKLKVLKIKKSIMRMLFVVSSYLIVLLLFSGCSKEAVYREEIKERISEKEALEVLYNHLYEEQETIENVTFVEAGEHTECNIEWEDDREVSIKYWGITDDELYMLFRLSSVESTLNFYAVNRETKEVIIQRIEDDDRGYIINKEYTKALEGTRNADVQYFCGIDYEILYDQHEIRNGTIQRIEDYFKTSIPELEEYEAYIKDKSNGKATLYIEFAKNWDELHGMVYGRVKDGESNFYCRVSIGEVWQDGHKVTWDWFYVRSDCKEILYCYLPSEACITLDEWRESPFYQDLSDGMVIRNIGDDILESRCRWDDYEVEPFALYSPAQEYYDRTDLFLDQVDQYMNGNEFIYDEMVDCLEENANSYDIINTIEILAERGYTILSYETLWFEDSEENIGEVPVIIYYARPQQNGMIEYRSVLLTFRLQKTEEGEIEIVGIEIMNPEWI